MLLTCLQSLQVHRLLELRDRGNFNIMTSALALLMIAQVPTELNAYVLRKDHAVTWKALQGGSGRASIDLVSQKWHGIVWKHRIEIDSPRVLRHKGTVLLCITGGAPNNADAQDARTLANLAGMPVATLYQIPNQPLWGKNEDALIAYTLQKWFETKDSSWPLLFPMTKSAFEAMNAIQAISARTNNPIRKFIPFGASKRGWTTWLLAATGDSRIIGAAPMVYDNLKISAQMSHQKTSWNRYSPMIRDYESTGMLKALATPDGKKLEAMVDPWRYRTSIKCPVFMVNGGNDPYWTVDALSLYWNDLKMPKSCLVVPNAGHDLGDKKWSIASLAAFASLTASGKRMPSIESSLVPKDDHLLLRAKVSGAKPKRVTTWAITSTDKNFVNFRWNPLPSEKPLPGYALTQRLWTPMEGAAAAMAVAEFAGPGGSSYFVTSRVHVFAK